MLSNFVTLQSLQLVDECFTRCENIKSGTFNCVVLFLSQEAQDPCPLLFALVWAQACVLILRHERFSTLLTMR